MVMDEGHYVKVYYTSVTFTQSSQHTNGKVCKQVGGSVCLVVHLKSQDTGIKKRKKKKENKPCDSVK